MKTKTIRSAFFAVVAVFLAATTAAPFAASAQSAALTAEQRLQKALELRADLDSLIRALEQEREDEEQAEVKTIPVVHQIDIMRERKEKLDRTIKKLKEEAAAGRRSRTEQSPHRPPRRRIKPPYPRPNVRRTSRSKCLWWRVRRSQPI